jgi:hypothetical protein
MSLDLNAATASSWWLASERVVLGSALEAGSYSNAIFFALIMILSTVNVLNDVI